MGTESSDSMILKDAVFLNNQVKNYGGGLWLRNGYADIIRAKFDGNKCSYQGGGAYIGGFAVADFYDCLFVNNESNKADFGGNGGALGIWTQDNPVNFVNCTFGKNKSTEDGQQFWLRGASINFLNCIIDSCHATKTDMIEDNGSPNTFNFQNCLLGRKLPSFCNDIAKNIVNRNMGFVSANNLSLTISSPAINKGNNKLRRTDFQIDLANNPRIFADTVDIGAYELQTNIPPQNIVTLAESKKFQMLPNPVHQFLTIAELPQNTEVSIYNNQGQLVMKAQSQSSTTNIDLSPLSSGAYFIQLKTSSGLLETQQVIKK